jgi:hypothetical protein
MVHRRRAAATVVALGFVLLPAVSARADDGKRAAKECQQWRRSCESECERQRREARDADAAIASRQSGLAHSIVAATDGVADEARRFARLSRGRQVQNPRTQDDDRCLPAPVVPEVPLGVLLPTSAALALGLGATVQHRRRSRIAVR